MNTLQLIKMDRELDLISRHVPFLAINPLNEEQEKKKFFASSTYNPQFIYTKGHPSLATYAGHLQSMQPIHGGVMANILEEKRKEYLDRVALIHNRGTENFTRWSLRVYGQPDNALIREARRHLKYPLESEGKVLTTQQVINMFRTALLTHGFNWVVKEKEMVANAAVSIHDKTLYLRKGVRFSKKSVKRLIVHEIGTHILRNENGRKQPYKVFARGLPGYLATEEGLALINEELHGCQNNALLKVYAGRVLAVDKSLTSSFRETFMFLCQFFPVDTAWRMTVRVKRGLSDTSKPGACTKDFLYLKGYCDLKGYIQEGGELSKLYYGKIGLHHLDDLSQIPWLVHPEYLPVVRYFEYFVSQISSLLKLQMHSPTDILASVPKKIRREAAQGVQKQTRLRTFVADAPSSPEVQP